MVLQDYVFMAGGFLFAAMLLPTLRDPRAKVPLATSAATGFVLVVYAVTFVTLDLYLAAFSSALTAVAWFAVAVLRRPGAPA